MIFEYTLSSYVLFIKMVDTEKSQFLSNIRKRDEDVLVDVK